MNTSLRLFEYDYNYVIKVNSVNLIKGTADCGVSLKILFLKKDNNDLKHSMSKFKFDSTSGTLDTLGSPQLGDDRPLPFSSLPL